MALGHWHLRQERFADSEPGEQNASSKRGEVVLVGAADALDETVDAKALGQSRDLPGVQLAELRANRQRLPGGGYATLPAPGLVPAPPSQLGHRPRAPLDPWLYCSPSVSYCLAWLGDMGDRWLTCEELPPACDPNSPQCGCWTLDSQQSGALLDGNGVLGLVVTDVLI